MALDFPVVGVGASAGGIGALQVLFGAMPFPVGMAFVVVQHLSPSHPSLLARLLGPATRLSVCEATDGARLQRDHVYVIAPGEVLSLSSGTLSSSRSCDTGTRVAELVDTFFISLAHDQQQNSVGVVLTGTGSDGAAGAVQIKLLGGTVFVQEPAGAEYPGMPSAAIAAGAADRVLRLKDLATALCEHAERRALPGGGCSGQRSDAAIEHVRRLVRVHSGLELGRGTSTPLLGRIQRRMAVRRIDSLPDYARCLDQDPSEIDALVRGIPFVR